MIRFLFIACALAVPFAARTQPPDVTPHAGHHHAMHGGEASAVTLPTEPGQGAFAAIQEIVGLLMADPNTDWSRIAIDELRRHLVDMSNITLHAEATASPIAHGLRFTVTGTGSVRESIRRTIAAHATTMSGQNGMSMAAGNHPAGATLRITVADPTDLPRLKGLGFFGVMTTGMHHQAHHLAIASGGNPHRH